MIKEFGYNDISQLSTAALLPGLGLTSQPVMFQPLCALLQLTKYLPLRYAPLEIELELADATGPIVSEFLLNLLQPTHLFFGKLKIVWSRLIYAPSILL